MIPPEADYEVSELGNIDAIYLLACIYYMDRGVDSNFEGTAKLYRVSCDMGDSNMMPRLCIVYLGWTKGIAIL